MKHQLAHAFWCQKVKTQVGLTFQSESLLSDIDYALIGNWTGPSLLVKHDMWTNSPSRVCQNAIYNL